MSEPDATPLFPVFLDLRGRLCVVVGEGERAERKARALVAAGGDVVVVCQHPSEALLELCTDGELTVEQRGYVVGDLENAALVLCMGQAGEIARAIASEARERHCLVNVSGMPELCDFIVPSTIGRGDLKVAVSTAGSSPEAARQARAAIEETLGAEWADYVALLAGVRTLIAERRLGRAEAADLLSRAGTPAVRERLAAGERLTAESLLAEIESGDETGSDTDDDEAGLE